MSTHTDTSSKQVPQAIIPLRPATGPTAARQSSPAGPRRRALGIKLNSRRTLSSKWPSLRTLGGHLPSRRALIPSEANGLPATRKGAATHHGPSTRGLTRVLAAFAAMILTLLAALVIASPASASEGPVLLRPGARCWPVNTSGVALIAVDPPQLHPMPSSVPVYVGADNQTVRYEAFLQRWNGSSWVTMAGGTGPLFTGTTNYYSTSFTGATGGWTGWNIARQSTRQNYRVVAQIWWVADSTHPAAYSSGVTDIQQYNATYGWNPVSYCSY